MKSTGKVQCTISTSHFLLVCAGHGHLALRYKEAYSENMADPGYLKGTLSKRKPLERKVKRNLETM